MSTESTKDGFRITGRVALAMFVAFFGIVFAVNGYMVYQAEKSWHGVDTPDAYVKGLDYNQLLDRAAAQKALGWRVTLSFDGARPVLRLVDRTGTPLDGLAVTGVARRPVDELADQPVHLVGVGDGVYRGDADLPAFGQWDLHLEVARRSGPPYLIEQRLWLPREKNG